MSYRIFIALALVGCSEAAVQCESDSDCASGERCLDDLCVVIVEDAGPPFDAGKPDGGNDGGVGVDGGMADGGEDAGMPVDASCDDPPPPADRPVAVACTTCRPTFEDPGPSEFGGCEAHSECTEAMNGRCVRAMVGTFCDYDECFDDDDCESGQLCSCDGSYYGGNSCVQSNCRVNSDCTSGGCAPSYGCLLGAPPDGWYCRTTTDECSEDSDCNDPKMAGGRCAYDSERALWSCDYGICLF